MTAPEVAEKSIPELLNFTRSTEPNCVIIGGNLCEEYIVIFVAISLVVKWQEFIHCPKHRFPLE